MTGHREVLTSYKKKKFTTQVELGDDSTYNIEGVGSASLQLDLGTVFHIDDVLYVPGLKKNLLYVASSFLPTYFELKLTIPSAKASHLFDSANQGIAAEN